MCEVKSAFTGNKEFTSNSRFVVNNGNIRFEIQQLGCDHEASGATADDEDFSHSFVIYFLLFS
jgi:hypothetical protein